MYILHHIFYAQDRLYTPCAIIYIVCVVHYSAACHDDDDVHVVCHHQIFQNMAVFVDYINKSSIHVHVHANMVQSGHISSKCYESLNSTPVEAHIHV